MGPERWSGAAAHPHREGTLCLTMLSQCFPLKLAGAPSFRALVPQGKEESQPAHTHFCTAPDHQRDFSPGCLEPSGVRVGAGGRLPFGLLRVSAPQLVASAAAAAASGPAG